MQDERYDRSENRGDEMKPLDEMTPEEIRLEIAERNGWAIEETEVTPGEIMYCIFCGDAQVSDQYYDENNAWYEIICNNTLPDWPASIAAVWELESEVPEEEHENYARHLNRIVNDWFDEQLNQGSEVKHQRFYLLHATPLQRSTAWLAWKRGQDGEL
jgi:hypothetical protein